MAKRKSSITETLTESVQKHCERCSKLYDGTKVSRFCKDCKKPVGPNIKYSDAELISALREASSHYNGKPLSQAMYYKVIKKPSFQIALKRFGSWEDACAMAGITFAFDRETKYTDRDISKALMSASKKAGGKVLTFELYDSFDLLPNASTICGRYGSWALAVQTHGIPSSGYSRAHRDHVQTLRNTLVQLG
ncbi:MAG: hypothetical protein K0Q73_5197, partial [Paenibacillus sp.]|nr:hypothetical protein [Paenibacillus sp.]